MIVAESGAMLAGRKVEIVGTDIARDQLARAREGVYSQFEVQRGLPVQMLMRYFKKEDANWRIADASAPWRSSVNSTCCRTCARWANSTWCSAATC